MLDTAWAAAWRAAFAETLNALVLLVAMAIVTLVLARRDLRLRSGDGVTTRS